MTDYRTMSEAISAHKTYAEQMKFMETMLECMVDRLGSRNVLAALAHVYEAKSAHLAEAWQDEKTAKQWDRTANKVHRFYQNTDFPI